MIGGIERYLVRQDRDVCTTERCQFDYLYAYLLDACHIADSDHSSVIEHARATRASDIILGASILIANIFSRNDECTRLRHGRSTNRSLKEIPRCVLERKRDEDSFNIFFFISYIRDYPVGISSNVTLSLLDVPSISFFPTRRAMKILLAFRAIHVGYAPCHCFFPVASRLPRRRGRTCVIATRPRGYPCRDITGTCTALDYWSVEEFRRVDR